jgi:hypothetical protein
MLAGLTVDLIKRLMPKDQAGVEALISSLGLKLTVIENEQEAESAVLELAKLTRQLGARVIKIEQGQFFWVGVFTTPLPPLASEEHNLGVEQSPSDALANTH